MLEHLSSDAGVATALRGKRVLVTGHSGFKGAWLCLWLRHIGAEVVGISLPPSTKPSMSEVVGIDDIVDSRTADIRDALALRGAADGVDAEVVFHLAAQPIVRKSYAAPAETFATNVVGTANVLDLARTMPSLRCVIVVTSDKCYDNVGQDRAYREKDRLGGADPYSASKACTELVADSYRRSWFADAAGAQIATVRAGNVIGGGDWAEDRLVPDIVRAASAGTPMFIRNPASIRPWQHVLEPLSAYLLLAAHMLSEGAASYAGAWNFGPSDAEVVDVETLAKAIMACTPELDIPVRFGSEPGAPYEPTTLRLDSSKAFTELGWRPRLSALDTVRLTADWYAAFLRGAVNMRAASRDQLSTFLDLQSAGNQEGLRQCA